MDCGAAEGLFALKIYGKCKRVYLIEPLSKFVGSLNMTFEKAYNVEILPLAISDKEYSTKISDNDISSALSDTEEGERVNVTTLDKIFLEKNIPGHYLKMDLEGHDFKALIGAEGLIRKYMPKIAVTTYHDINHASQIANFLKSIAPDYNIFCKGIYQETGSPVMLHAWIDKQV
ncbi:MAG TPA: FkbM family methyltransferase [Chitinophagaceae bacterium]|nr:FkbM family methyltransferase [Chitinophagaceae bacterium]